jgi:hypothetical protein
MALAAGVYIAVLSVHIAGQTARPLPGDPLPGITSGEFEEFRLGLEDFTEVETPEDGLGPAFNGSSCAVCHSVPAIGGAGVVAEVRAARRDEHGEFVELVPTSGSLFQIFSIPTYTPADHSAGSERDRAARADPLFGAGLVEAISDETLLALDDSGDRTAGGIAAGHDHHGYRHRQAPRRTLRLEVAARRCWRSLPMPTATGWGSPTTSFRRSSRSGSRPSR